MRNKEPHGLTGYESLRSSYRPRSTQVNPAVLAEAGTRGAADSARVTSERARRQRKKGASKSSWPRRLIKWTIGSGAALSGFVAVLWLTGPVTVSNNRAIAVLTNAAVSDATSLMAAVQTAGLRGTADVKGAIEEIRRLDNSRATIKGWATDMTAPGAALTVVVFAGGKHVLTTATEGARLDIARTLGLADSSGTNMSFEGAFACSAGEKIVVVAVTSGAAYSQFRSMACP